MAISMRKGLSADFDPSKLLAGEWAVTIDPESKNQIVYMCFGAGIVKRMGTFEDIEGWVKEAIEPYEDEFDEVLNECRNLNNEVLIVKNQIDTIYLPQIEEAVEQAQEYAEQSKTDYSHMEREVDNRIKKFYTSNMLSEHVEDSDDGAIRDLKIYGRSEQASTSGKNLMDLTGLTTYSSNGVTFTPVYDGNKLLYIHVKTTSEQTANAIFVMKTNVVLDTNTQYILSSKQFGDCYLQYYDENEVYNTNVKDNVLFKPSITTFKSIRIVARKKEGIVWDTKIYPMLRLASVTDDTYEPYTGGQPSPSPSFPQQIHSVVNPKMEVVGRNLLDGRMRYGNAGDITPKTRICNTGRLYVQSGKPYTISINNNFLLNYSIFSDNAEPASISNRLYDSPWITFTNGKYTAVPPVSGFMAFSFKNSDGTEITQAELDSFKMQVGYSTKATLNGITLNAIPVTSGGNVTINGQQYISDYVDVEAKGVWKYLNILKAKDMIWKIDSAWSGSDYFSYVCRMEVKGLPDSNKNAYSNVFTPKPRQSYSANLRNCVISAGGSYIDAIGTPFPTLKDWTDYINSNDVEFLYPLAEPIFEPLTDEQVEQFLVLRSYYGTTNATVTSDDLDGASEFLYPCSIENFVEYVKEQTGDTREFVYDLADLSEQAFINSQYAEVMLEFMN